MSDSYDDRLKRFRDKLRSAFDEFNAILLDSPTEEELQRVLTKHPQLLTSVLHGADGIIPKLRLGAEYVTDFVAWSERQTGVYWQFIEIEPSHFKLFNKAGDPTKELTHAVGQVQSWRRWASDNRSYCQSILKNVFKDIHPEFPDWYLDREFRIDDLKCTVIIGRKDTLSTDNLDRLHQMNVDTNGRIEVMTYDRIVDTTRRSLQWFSEDLSKRNL